MKLSFSCVSIDYLRVSRFFYFIKYLKLFPYTVIKDVNHTKQDLKFHMAMTNMIESHVEYVKCRALKS